MVYHIFYKTTNNINGKYYYGVHSTNKLDDGYIGSGKLLTRAVRKYGKENFTKEILAIFDSKEEAFLLEKNVVTKDLVDNHECYNVKLGGQSGHTTFKTAAARAENSVKEKYITQKKKAEERTEAQRLSSERHAFRQKGRLPHNKKEVVLFGVSYKSVTEAMKDQGLSPSHYYFMKKSDIRFDTAEQLRRYTWELRNSRIKSRRWGMGG